MTQSERFQALVLSTADLSVDAQNRVIDDIEKYDKPVLDSLTEPTAFVVSNYGTVSIHPASRYRVDPFTAKAFAKGYDGSAYRFYVFHDGEFDGPVTADTVNWFLYDHAKAMGFPEIGTLNTVEGAIVSWSELCGSIPEHFRPLIDDDGWERLRRTFVNEVETILGYLRTKSCRRRIGNGDNDEEFEWVTYEITKLSVIFGRFEQIGEDATQTTAFFSVSDASPDFKPEYKPNWFLQDTSRWLYAGAIALTKYGDKVDVSSHH